MRRARELHRRERELLEKREFFTFQLGEIDAVGPRPGEEEELERELKILENSERLFGSTGRIYEMLYEGEQSIHDQLVIVRNQLQNLSEIDDRFREAAAECSSAEAVVSELAKFIQGYNARVEFNPERLEELRERLGRITMLKKKYGGSLEGRARILRCSQQPHPEDSRGQESERVERRRAETLHRPAHLIHGRLQPKNQLREPVAHLLRHRAFGLFEQPQRAQRRFALDTLRPGRLRAGCEMMLRGSGEGGRLYVELAVTRGEIRALGLLSQRTLDIIVIPARALLRRVGRHVGHRAARAPGRTAPR